ncbi:hypothetical protein Tco_0029882, partial [Tanacetum coccineum]
MTCNLESFRPQSINVIPLDTKTYNSHFLYKISYLFGLFCAVTYTLAVFAKMFKKARDENEQIAEAEKKKLEKEAQKEHSSANKKEGVDVDSKKDLRNMIRDTSLSIKKRDA